MSTDLQQLCQDLPKVMIKLSPIKILTREEEEEKEDVGVIIQQKGSTETDQLCKTPTSEEHKIPEILCCPKAPKKAKTRSTISCKRKLADEFQFFEILNRDEIDEFFRSNNMKRRCF